MRINGSKIIRGMKAAAVKEQRRNAKLKGNMKGTGGAPKKAALAFYGGAAAVAGGAAVSNRSAAAKKAAQTKSAKGGR